MFPTRGHSFLPPDRVFGGIEKKIKSLEVVGNPEEYMQLIADRSTVLMADQDFHFFDWKEAADLTRDGND